MTSPPAPATRSLVLTTRVAAGLVLGLVGAAACHVEPTASARPTPDPSREPSLEAVTRLLDRKLLEHPPQQNPLFLNHCVAALHKIQ